MAILYLVEQGSLLRKELRRFVVEKEGNILLEIPEFKVERVVIVGNVHLTTPAIKFLLQSQIETSFLSARGKLIGKLSPIESKNIKLRFLQYERYKDDKFRLSFSKSIIKAKIKNSKVLLQKYQRNHPEANFENYVKELDDLLRELERKQNVSSIFGLEGRASAAYFSCYGKMFRKDLQFQSRSKNPPRDPVNSLLSLGYSLITNEVLSALSSLGFDPYIGYLHGIEYGRPSLALDLVEEFRAPIIDRLTLELVNKSILSLEDFEQRDEGSFLKDQSRKKYFFHYEKRMQDTFQISANKTIANYRKFFLLQAQKFVRVITAKSEYEPFTIK